jgi:hypothetical protein
MATLAFVTVLAAWRVLRFIDDWFGLDTFPKAARAAVLVLAVAALIFPDEFETATAAFIPELTAEWTATWQRITEPILDAVRRDYGG